MASYTNLTVREDVEYIGGTQTREVVTVALSTVPHGVYYETRLPRAGFTAALAKSAAENGAAYIEQVFNTPNVAGVEFIQNVTPAGLLADTWVIYVQSDSGNSSASFQMPVTTFDLADAASQATALAAELNSLEAS